MFHPFICGAVDPRDEEDDRRKSSRKNSFSKSKGSKKDTNKNPYSDRGLDKFSALLAELEEKKQKIYSQTGSQDISFVRFRSKNSTDFVPIVVKLKDKKLEEAKTTDTTKGTNLDSQVIDKHAVQNFVQGKEVIKKISSGLQSPVSDEKKKRKSCSWRRPSCYLPAFLVLILLLLVFFGRSVSILCTCIGWYTVPIMQEKRNDKKKDHPMRKPSDGKTGIVRYQSFQVRDHQFGNLIKKKQKEP